MKKKKAKKQLQKKKSKSLKELHKAAEEHYRLLTPTPKYVKRKGYYINFAYKLNYEQLGYTLESIINVCIMGLDGYDLHNEARDIKEAHKQFADVLEFSKKLIPHAEFKFLDKSRKLLLDND
ncbi:hypothetical protein NO995_07595 [Aestuariibaculum sp. M13]|uniref:hypothetical protein n=1 Tax=Aestuariibaculum sp. M13 TaxID=2967132 RepID=UPI002159EFFE|nr:hypothetical protein [Aestuariibaculum sp. M13]MCR8667539.1 hypothetical protein [Aestuariibaculum sp. M13]